MTRFLQVHVDDNDEARDGLALLAACGYAFAPTAGRRGPDGTTRWFRQPGIDLGTAPVELLPGVTATPGQRVRLTVDPAPAPGWLVAWVLRGRPLVVSRAMEVAA